MSLRSIVAASVVGLAVVACGPQEDATDADGTWIGTITTEGNVTTVINESGSVWGGTGTLVEEVSIGVESGADEYMFGLVNSVYATEDRIYVADVQVPAVRVYDHDGNFIRNLGRSGEGPGEYQYPAAVAADSTGRAFVLTSQNGRINVYSPSGEPLDSWPMPSAWCCAWPMYLLTGESLWAPVQVRIEGRRERRYGLQAIGPSGPYGDIEFIPELEYEETTYEVRPGFEPKTPFSASLVSNPAPDGRMLVGASDRYRFAVHARDGSTVVVEKHWDPVPVPPEHKEWERRYAVAFQRRGNAPEFTWDGAEIPDHKPAYRQLLPTLSGETWVARLGASVRLPDCVEDPVEAGQQAAWENPCWSNEEIVDAFDADGRYLGEVEMPPPGVRLSALRLFIDGRMVVAHVVDEAGTIMVKRYRLVLPGER